MNIIHIKRHCIMCDHDYKTGEVFDPLIRVYKNNCLQEEPKQSVQIFVDQSGNMPIGHGICDTCLDKVRIHDAVLIIGVENYHKIYPDVTFENIKPFNMAIGIPRDQFEELFPYIKGKPDYAFVGPEVISTMADTINKGRVGYV